MLEKVLFVLFLVSFTNAINNEHYYKNKISTAIEKLYDFVTREPNLNFDGLFGIVHSKALIKSMLDENYVAADTKMLANLYKKASTAAEKVLTQLPKESRIINIFKKYLMQEKLWKKNIDFTSGLLNYHPSIIFNADDLMDFLNSLKSNVTVEKTSDFCIVSLLEETKNDEAQICTVSDTCIDFINNKKDAAYGITHKLLYLQIARAKRCVFDKMWFNEKTRDYCSQILWEANQIRDLKLDHYLFDLLVEQIYLCGYEGYAEFLNKEWLDQILSLQNSKGCYSSEVRINKREINRIKYGCSDHTTGLVSAVLSLYYYYIVKNKRPQKI